jgi:hypothetical protein
VVFDLDSGCFGTFGFGGDGGVRGCLGFGHGGPPWDLAYRNRLEWVGRGWP